MRRPGQEVQLDGITVSRRNRKKAMKGASSPIPERQPDAPSQLTREGMQLISDLRDSVKSIDSNTADFLHDSRTPKRGSRLRSWLELIAGFGAVVAIVLALIGNFQNAEGLRQNTEELQGLADSLQRSHVESAFDIGVGWCGDPDRDVVTSLVGSTYLTNVGRLPITVMYVGDGSDWIGDFTYVRVDDEIPTARKGPFHLDVGEAVAVAFDDTTPDSAPSQLTLQLSDGSTVVTETVGGDSRWLVLTDIPLVLGAADIACSSGSRLALPLSQIANPDPDWVAAVPRDKNDGYTLNSTEGISFTCFGDLCTSVVNAPHE